MPWWARFRGRFSLPVHAFVCLFSCCFLCFVFRVYFVSSHGVSSRYFFHHSISSQLTKPLIPCARSITDCSRLLCVWCSKINISMVDSESSKAADKSGGEYFRRRRMEHFICSATLMLSRRIWSNLRILSVRTCSLRISENSTSKSPSSWEMLMFVKNPRSTWYSLTYIQHPQMTE